MTHARAILLAVGATLIAVGAACSSSSSDFFGASSSGGPNASSGTSSSSGSSSSGSSPTTSGPAATGVLLVHAAAFPSFRLCFENFPTLAPQPDATVMPEANVVGVEIGSLVRLDQMTAPGTVYVLRESAVRSPPGQTNPTTCGELIATDPQQKTDKTLTQNIDYFVANGIAQNIGQTKPTVLAITGCGSQALLTYALGVSSASCGTDWDVTKGNLKAEVVQLNTTFGVATNSSLPVQLFQMSTALDAFKGPTGRLSVTFGDLAPDAGAAPQDVDAGALFAPGPQTNLAVKQTDNAMYGSHGFRVVAGPANAPFTLDESLAAVQELSSPRELPTSYYRAASNYALLLLGDPSHTPSFADGGVNPLYNPRQAVHILAVPVIDPAALDAGTNDGGGGGT